MSKNDDTKVNTAISKSKTTTIKKNTSGINLSKLSNLRIIQKHLVYVIGLSSHLANKEVLGKYEYFGQYGTILKIVVNKSKAYNPNGPNGPSFSAYISYSMEQEASIAILAIDNIEIDDHILRASYGTTKYCTFFLKNCDCPNKDCLYLHELADENDIINKDDMNSNTNVFYDQQILAMKLSDIFNPEVKKKLKLPPKKKCVFPTSETIYSKDIVLAQSENIEEKVGGGKYYDSPSKSKKKYNEDCYCKYYKNRDTRDSDYYNLEEDQENDYDQGIQYEGDQLPLYKEKSETFSTMKNESLGCNIPKERTNSAEKKDTENSNSKIGKSKFSNELVSSTSEPKFMSKSKSPITNKKKNMNENGPEHTSLTPHVKKIGLDEKFKTFKKDTDNTMEIKTIGVENITQVNVKRLYRKHEHSRFSFAIRDNSAVKEPNAILGNMNNLTPVNMNTHKKSDNQVIISSSTSSDILVNNSNIDEKIGCNGDIETKVPDFVFDVISKKISRHAFFKKFDKHFTMVNNNDTEFFEKQLKQNDSWSKFIITNLNCDKSNKMK